MSNFHIQRLSLTHFRNFEHLTLHADAPIMVLCGVNGVGKTNILEAISLLSPGKGVRGAKLDELVNQSTGASGWGIAADVRQPDGDVVKVGTAWQLGQERGRRAIKIDGEKVKHQAELAFVSSMLWQTPQMDGLFLGSSQDRRKFMDRLVLSFDSEHAKRVYSYEYAVRERQKLLQFGGDGDWIAILEQKMAQKSVSIVTARLKMLEMLQVSIDEAPGVFPKALVTTKGYVEDLLSDRDAGDVEMFIQEQLKQSREQDLQSKRTHLGAHRSDLHVLFSEKNMVASSCSTGEQKALLMSIVLGEARARYQWKRAAPMLLLDEVVAHLDERRREALFDELVTLGVHAWMTGTDQAVFAPLHGYAEFKSMDEIEAQAA